MFKNKKYYILSLMLIITFTTAGYAKSNNKSKMDSFFDPTHDYSNTIGRVTDIGESQNILKIWSEDKNLRLLQDGDLMYFRLFSSKTNYCTSHVRSSQGDYIIIYVDDWSACWNSEKYFRRGTKLKIKSDQLKLRVQQASIHRQVILKRKSDFLKQMNKINNFLWRFNEEKLKVSSDYDQKIIEVRKSKEIAMARLQDRRRDYLELQDVLRRRLDNIDEKVKFYKVDNYELNDRWDKDLHLGLPISRRPYEYTRIKRLDVKRAQ